MSRNTPALALGKKPHTDDEARETKETNRRPGLASYHRRFLQSAVYQSGAIELPIPSLPSYHFSTHRHFLPDWIEGVGSLKRQKI
ncbi:hypothetical protein K0M31_004352 [Melipona bicolor]|uniref:Uncharacterized protein n=1 Tax=Melipona bicolor TaxID=60889 RepID=A0AA40FWL8_9HYME|nr:hypothetical protein K0M31_004352 [Melipona bicolor]